MVSQSQMVDVYLCIEFGLAIIGIFLWFFFHFESGYWWVFGGFLIFISPFLGKGMDNALEKRDDKIEYAPIIERY